MNLLIALAIGAMIGIISGMIGLGGAIFLIPILVYGYGMDQKSAQGTSLATLLLPIGALAFWKYYSAGHVNLKLAALFGAGRRWGEVMSQERFLERSSDPCRGLRIGIRKMAPPSRAGNDSDHCSDCEGNQQIHGILHFLLDSSANEHIRRIA